MRQGYCGRNYVKRHCAKTCGGSQDYAAQVKVMKAFMKAKLNDQMAKAANGGRMHVAFYRGLVEAGKTAVVHAEPYIHASKANGKPFQFRLVRKFSYTYSDTTPEYSKLNTGDAGGTLLTYKYVATVNGNEWFATKRTVGCFLLSGMTRFSIAKFGMKKKLDPKVAKMCFRTTWSIDDKHNKKRLAACREAAYYIKEHPCGGWGKGATAIRQKCWNIKQALIPDHTHAHVDL